MDTFQELAERDFRPSRTLTKSGVLAHAIITSVFTERTGWEMVSDGSTETNIVMDFMKDEVFVTFDLEIYNDTVDGIVVVMGGKSYDEDYEISDVSITGRLKKTLERITKDNNLFESLDERNMGKTIAPEYYEQLRIMAHNGELDFDDIRSMKGQVEYDELLDLIKGIR